MIDDLLPPGDPDLDALHERLRGIWNWVFMTPVMYALVAWGLLALGWVADPGAAPHAWDTAPARWLLGGMAICLAGLLAGLRLRRRAVVRMLAHDREAAARRYTWHFLALLCLADGFSFFSLVYFCVSGRIMALLAGGALTYLGYFLAMPGRRDLEA